VAEYAVFIHAGADVHPTVHLGHGSRVWNGAVILEGTTLGEHCTVGNGVFIGRRCQIGDDVAVHPGAAIPDGAVIGNRVYIGASVTLTDVKRPCLADRTQEVHCPPVIGDDVAVGCNAVLLPGVVIGAGATVGAGSVVTRDVAAGCTVVGNPARRIQYKPPRPPWSYHASSTDATR
jgi:acetyltransferase-like isoleucine patch superfamily enzyme